MAITDNYPLIFLDLDDDAADDSVNGMAFTNVGTVTFGGAGNGASFNGSSQSLLFVPTVNTTTTFTWMAWVKPTAVTGYNALFADNGAVHALYIHGGKLDYFDGSDHDAGTAISNGVWTHVAISVSGGSLTYYINGVSDGTATAATVVLKTIGWDDFPGEYYHGAMRAMALYGVAISGADIAAVVAAGSSATFSSLGYTVGGGSAVADPTVISGCKLWLKSDTGVYKDSGTTPSGNGEKVLQWNDQSGQGNNCTHADNSDEPLYVSSGSDKRVVFNSGDAITKLLFPAAYSVNQRSHTAFFVLDMNAVEQNSVLLDLTNAGTMQLQFIGDNIKVTSVSTGLRVPSQRVAIVCNCNANYVRSYLNQVTSAAATIVQGAASSANVGIGDATSGIKGSLLEFAIYDNSLTPANTDKLLAYALAKYSIPTTYTYRVVCEGDSLTQGVGSTLQKSWPKVMALPSSSQLWNFGLVGSNISDLTTRVTALVDSIVDPTKGYLFVYAGTNDSSGGRTAAQIFADLKTYCQARKTAGWHKVILFSFHVNSATLNTASADLEGDFTTATAYPRLWGPAGGITYADYLYDLHNQPLIGEVSGTQGDYLVGDNVHFNDAGYAILAAEVASYFPELGNPPVAGTLSQTSVTSTSAELHYATVTSGTPPYSNQLRRSLISGSGYSNIGSPVVGATAIYLDDEPLTPATDYYYIVVTTDNASQTATSNEVHVTTSGAPTVDVQPIRPTSAYMPSFPRIHGIVTKRPMAEKE